MNARQKASSFKNSKSKQKLTVVTAYDAPTAALLEEAGVDMILIGDSAATVVLGYNATPEVSMDEMIVLSKAVRRGAPNSFVVGDMPLKGVSGGPRHALKSARRFVREAGCDAVKLEWNAHAEQASRLIIKAGIPLMGHVGLTPQAFKPRDFKVQGQTAPEAARIINEAKRLERAGAFSIVLELVPAPLASEITKELKIPTIGIGASRGCDGQVLVFHDLVGLTPLFKARFIKRYALSRDIQKKAVEHFVQDVRTGRFPSPKHSFKMKPGEKKELGRMLRKKR